MGFADHHRWFDNGERFPNPIIIAVHIKGQQINRPTEAGIQNELIDVFDRDPPAMEIGRARESVLVVGVKRPAAHNIVGIAIKQVPPPAVIDDQVGGVALDAGAGADFEASPAFGSDDREQVEQDSILLKLGILPEAHLFEARQWMLRHSTQSLVVLLEDQLGHLRISLTLQQRGEPG